MSDWISVDDRLPEEVVPVLAAYRMIPNRSPYNFDVFSIRKSRWMLGGVRMCSVYGDQVTHWMPLPPPEEEVEPTPVQTEALWRTLRNSTTLLPGDPEEEA